MDKRINLLYFSPTGTTAHVVEAVAAGARPLAPDRLAYPEVLGRLTQPDPPDEYLYDGSVPDLVARLTEQIERIEKGPPAQDVLARRANDVYAWNRRAPALDDAIEAAVGAA